MGRYIDWYLVEVERRLAGNLSREKLHETIGEVEAHLVTAKEDAMQLGMRDAESELAAIESFGSARRFGCRSGTAPRRLRAAHPECAGTLDRHSR